MVKHCLAMIKMVMDECAVALGRDGCIAGYSYTVLSFYVIVASITCRITKCLWPEVKYNTLLTTSGIQRILID